MTELGKLTLAGGDTKRAEALLSRALELDPELDDAEYALAESHGKNGDVREQWVHLGRAFELRGDLARAQSAYEKALDLTPDEKAARADLEQAIKAIGRVGTGAVPR